jgi:hypothetical protein
MRFSLSLPRAVYWLVTLVGLTGCFKYTPLATSSPALGARIAVDLTSMGSDTLARFVGPNVTGIEGRVLQVTASDLLLAVSVVRQRNGEEDFWKGETVSIPRGVILGMRQRHLSTSRTLLLAGAVAAAGATVGAAATGSSSGGGGNGGGPPPVE